MREESRRLIHSVKSIRDASMRERVLAEKMHNASLAHIFSAMEDLIGRGGQGNTDVSLTLSTLIAVLEPPSLFAYQSRADLYALANDRGATTLAYILLEGDEGSSSIQDEDKGRPLTPNGQVVTLGARKSAARTRDRILISQLARDPNHQVLEILLSNPNLLESDVVTMASRRPAHPAALRTISSHRQWAQRYAVRYALTFNPNSPLPLSCRLCLDLRNSDLREIARNTSSHALLRGHAERLLQKRLVN